MLICYVCVDLNLPLGITKSMLTGLMYHRPEEPLEYLENCLKKVREIGGLEKVRWDMFIVQEKRALPAVGGSQGKRTIYRSAFSESRSISHYRYDRLPPIHQFSIESDTDLSETDELIEEYMVFDPSKPRPRIILVIGGPASGKGTQSMKVAERYGFVHISVGELLRDKMLHNASNNRKWGLIAKIIMNGELAPQETTITEIKQKLMQQPDSPGFVIDGFPREVSQAICFDDQICVPDLVIYLSCATCHLKERLEKRAEEGRPDNNPKAIQRRLVTFKQNTVPLVQYYQERNLIVTFDGDRPEGEVFDEIRATVDGKLTPNNEPVPGTSRSAGVSPKAEKQIAAAAASASAEELLQEKLKVTKIIFVIGGPGSGKGSQCEKMMEKYGFTHLSTGNLLRKEISNETERGNKIKKIMLEGGLVPLGTTLEILKDAMLENLQETKGFMIDGYPRTLKQAEAFDKSFTLPTVVLLIDCSPEVMKERLINRGQTSERFDDNEVTIAKRVESYFVDSVPVVKHYDAKGLLKKIQGEGTEDDVFQSITAIIDEL
ncbi:adenylate kinase isoenzyme 5-like isoform X2 [Stegostoma tigrinum]|uniref:adenylate kinase isoenzyme 5-like isoform X2 n=1 Tax=Stegostoma tigrinum TaxID=3053191 RepID=UPI00286FE3C2|nr:adenylate kinase isoenzyme 5-like isoform X2 [Stegostoma tigrinum]